MSSALSPVVDSRRNPLRGAHLESNLLRLDLVQAQLTPATVDLMRAGQLAVSVPCTRAVFWDLVRTRGLKILDGFNEAIAGVALIWWPRPRAFDYAVIYHLPTMQKVLLRNYSGSVRDPVVRDRQVKQDLTLWLAANLGQTSPVFVGDI